MEIVPASVLVIESHPLMREALCAAIAEESDMKVGFQAASGTEALEMVKVVTPEIILFALENPVSDGLESLSALRRALPDTPILALTSNEVAGQERAALDAGAYAVLNKAVARIELIEVLHELQAKAIVDHLKRELEKEVEVAEEIFPYTSQLEQAEGPACTNSRQEKGK